MLSQKFIELIFAPVVTGIVPVMGGAKDEGSTEGGTDLDGLRT